MDGNDPGAPESQQAPTPCLIALLGIGADGSGVGAQSVYWVSRRAPCPGRSAPAWRWRWLQAYGLDSPSQRVRTVSTEICSCLALGEMAQGLGLEYPNRAGAHRVQVDLPLRGVGRDGLQQRGVARDGEEHVKHLAQVRHVVHCARAAHKSARASHNRGCMK